MGFQDFPRQSDVVQLLQRSLARGRLGHAYLFHGPNLDELEAVARTLAKTLDCESPPRRGDGGLALDSCDACGSCRKIDHAGHPDVTWLRPESKSRVITINQVRDLLQTVYLKPTQSPFKVAMIVAADRLNIAAANAFLKTLEEPPADSILVLLSTEPQRMLETILSRCLRLNFSGESRLADDPAMLAVLDQFSSMAAGRHGSLLARYQLLSVVLTRLTEIRAVVEETLTARSPLERFEDIDPKLKEKWEDELTAAIEAEYRRQRGDLLSALQWWLRDVWLATLRTSRNLFAYPQWAAQAETVGGRISSRDAVENIGLVEEMLRHLAGNVQEALTLEVGLLRMKM